MPPAARAPRAVRHSTAAGVSRFEFFFFAHFFFRGAAMFHVERGRPRAAGRDGGRPRIWTHTPPWTGPPSRVFSNPCQKSIGIKNPRVEVRMRAAIAALPFESPKLAVMAVVSEQDFAAVLDRRLKRIEEMRLLESVNG